MRGDGTWFDRVERLGRSQMATQAAVLLTVVALAGLAAWIMLSAPTNARGAATVQSARLSQSQTTVGQVVQTEPAAAVPAQKVEAALAPDQDPDVTSPARAAPSEPASVDGLKISWQSWHRGGLGSNALISFTLRNNNDYAVKDVEIACAFSRSDGSHLTDRKRILPDTVINMKSRKTFARVHIGYVNIYANKAKCVPVAANRT